MRKREEIVDAAEKSLLQTKKWNHALTRLVWVLCAVLVCMEGALSVVYAMGITLGSDLPLEEYLLRYFLYPCVIIVGTNLIMQVLVRVLGRVISADWQGRLIVVSLVLIVTETCAFHYGISVIYALYVIPILAAVLYVNRATLNTVYILSVLCYLGVFFFYIRLYAPAGQWRHTYMDVMGTLVLLSSAFVIGHMVLRRVRDLIDISVEQSVREERLSREVTLDSLTQLYNHATFYEKLDEFILEHQRAGAPFSVIIMDIDNFKTVNDTYGHDVGNAVLLGLVEIIREKLGEDEIAFRYGGEEFAILTPHADNATQLAQSIRLAFSRRSFPGIEQRVTVSCGVCAYDNSFGGRREIFSAADKALYQAKNSGKNCVRLAT